MAIWSETHGNGPDLVMLHGWGLHSGVWGDIVESLSTSYRVTLIDLPGHGRSDMPSGGYSVRDLAEAVKAVTPTGAVWLGWSLGGLVAMRAALDFPDHISRLILVAAFPSFVQDDGWQHAVAPSVLEGFARGLEEDYRSTLLSFLALQARGSGRAREEIRRLREGLFDHGEPQVEALRGGLNILKSANMRGEISGLVQPTLLVAGENDTLAPAAGVAEMSQLLPSAQLCTIAGAGHAPFLSHRPEFEACVRTFLDE